MSASRTVGAQKSERDAFEPFEVATVARLVTATSRQVAVPVGLAPKPVAFDFIIGADGRVEEASIRSLTDDYVAAGSEILRALRYSPARLRNGNAVRQHARETIEFVKGGAAASAAPTRPPNLVVEDVRFADGDGDNILSGGERATLQFTLRNTGSGSARGVRVSEATGAIQWQSVAVGSIEPGGTRRTSLQLTGNTNLRDALAEVRVLVREANGFDAQALAVHLRTRAYRAPTLRVEDVAVEDTEGRSIIRAGQVVTITIRVRNDGEGRAVGVNARLAVGSNVFLAEVEGSPREIVVPLGDIGPGQYRDFKTSAFANNRASAFPIVVSLEEATGRSSVPARDLGLVLDKTMRASAEFSVAAMEPVRGSTRTNDAPSLSSDIGKNIPQSRTSNPNAVAVVVGNRTYRSGVPSVAYALNDAMLMREYLVRTLGYMADNILFFEDASLSDLRMTFGDRGTATGRLRDLVKPGKSDVFVFYSGHGAPDPNAKSAYLVPVDADVNRLELTGFSLDVLYENLALLKARSIVVVVDACFSGASGDGALLVRAASPIGIQVNDPAVKLGSGAVVVTAARGSQIASWFPEQRHGLLTYFFLKGLQGSADANADGRVTVSEIKSFLSDPTEGLPYWARRLHGREQMPRIFGNDSTYIR